MAWQQWTYLVLSVVGIAYMATRVGMPRGPITGREIASSIVTSALFVALVLSI